MNPFATIIVPTYNQAQYLSNALDSILAQTDPSWEAIVVNDGSTDRTAAIIDSYAARDSRIRAVHKENGGVASALNRGLMEARGEWIHWLSSDDMFEPEKLAINRHWIEAVPDGNFFFSYFTLLTDSTGKKERRQLWGSLPDSEHQILGLFHRNYVSGISICVRRAAWERVGFFNEELYYAQDYDQWLRLLSKNRGVFIPDWTVISRNHAAQGSETFPDACYFDTAKAAIKFINGHSFPELVPWSDLSNGLAASAAIVSALDVACDRSSFLYCLGPHPALVLRVLEWVYSREDREHNHKELVRSRIEEMALRDSDDGDWSWMWCQLALSLAGEAKGFCYFPIEPAELGLRLYRSRQFRNESAQQPIREYLRRFMNIEVPLEWPPEAGNARIVFFVRGQVEMLSAFRDIADRLTGLGYRPIILISGQSAETPSYEWHPSVPTIRVISLDHNTLPWLGEFELGITLPNEKVPVWAGAKQQINWDDCVSEEANLQQILLSQGVNAENPIRPVIFLERVLWGGGAERVVYDIVRNLNRRRYRPVIFTMFDEHCKGPDLPADVEVINIRQELFSAADGACMLHVNAEIKTLTVIKRLVRWLRGFYHYLLSPDLRRRLGVGQLVLRLRGWLKAYKLGTMNLLANNAETLKSSSTNSQVHLDTDFINAMAQHNPAAHSLSKIVQKFGSESVLVAVMEEASVTTWLAQAAHRFPYLLSLHTYESLCLPLIYPTPSRCKAEKWLLSSACKDALNVVLPSIGCANDLAENFDINKAKIKAIWNPIDCSQVRRQSWVQLPEVSAWIKSNDKFRMVHVGRLDEQKNQHLLLLACSQLIRRGRDFSLAIIGGGQDRPWIEQQIQERGLQHHVFLAGEQKNPFPWMTAADALLLSSRFEAFALVLVEAMVCGTAVISVDCPAGPAEVLANGKYGLLVPNDECEAIATAVERVMDDDSLKECLVQGGYLRAEDFDVKNIVPQWEALVDAIPRGRR